MSLDPSAAAFLLQHRISCRDRVRAVKLTGDLRPALPVLKALSLSYHEEDRVKAWRAAGFGRLDAIRIVVDPAMRPGAPR